mgnify:CR=1 FL=1
MILTLIAFGAMHSMPQTSHATRLNTSVNPSFYLFVVHHLADE